MHQRFLLTFLCSQSDGPSSQGVLDCAAPAFAALFAFFELAQAVITVAIRINEVRDGVDSLHFVSDLLLALLTAG